MFLVSHEEALHGSSYFDSEASMKSFGAQCILSACEAETNSKEEISSVQTTESFVKAENELFSRLRSICIIMSKTRKIVFDITISEYFVMVLMIPCQEKAIICKLKKFDFKKWRKQNKGYTG